jgi:hypothetical protein
MSLYLSPRIAKVLVLSALLAAPLSLCSSQTAESVYESTAGSVAVLKAYDKSERLVASGSGFWVTEGDACG